jgi:hypothetical protein
LLREKVREKVWTVTFSKLCNEKGKMDYHVICLKVYKHGVALIMISVSAFIQSRNTNIDLPYLTMKSYKRNNTCSTSRG